MYLTTLVVLLSSITGQPCVAIDNGTNRAAVKVPYHHVERYTYTDYGDNLGYDHPLPKVSWPAVRRTEYLLRQGAPAHKVRVACQS